MRIMLQSVMWRWNWLKIELFRCRDKIAPLLAALLGCMLVNCSIKDLHPQPQHQGWFQIIFFPQPQPHPPLPPPPPSSLFQSKSSNFPTSHWQWRGHVHTCCRLTPEHLCWSVQVVRSFFFFFSFSFLWRKQVVKRHQPCVQWNAFQETTTTTTLKP